VSDGPLAARALALLRREVGARAAAGRPDAGMATDALAALVDGDPASEDALAEALEERRRMDPLGPGARDDPGPRERRAARRWEARQAIGRLVLAGELVPDGPDRVLLPGFGASTWRAIALLAGDPGLARAWAEAVAAEPLADLGDAAPGGLRAPPGGPLAEEAAALHALEALRQDLRHALIGAVGAMGRALERGLAGSADALAAECAGLTEHLEALDREVARAWDAGARAAVRYARLG
jgi:hypothetical protein